MNLPDSLNSPKWNTLRTETLATRVSSAEMLAVEAAARAGGITRSEWLRDAALAHLHQPNPKPPISLESTVLTEIMGLRLLLLNILPPVIPGFTGESLQKIMRFADSLKREQAEGILRRVLEDNVAE